MKILFIVLFGLSGFLAQAQNPSGDSAPAPSDAVEPASSDPSAPLEDGATIVEVYDGSVATLEGVCDDYRRIKALELSKMRDIAFLDAYRHIQSVMPVLDPIDRELLRRPITDPNDIQAHKREVERVEGEVANMVDLVARLLLEIEEIQQQMAEAETTADKATTLAEIVQQPEYDPEKEEQVEQKQAQANSPEMKELIKKATETPEQPAVDITKEMQALMPPPSPPEGSVASTPSSQGGVKSKANPTNQDPDQNSEVGRRVVDAAGAPVEWMHIDTWYTIGPFPNPKRININTKFPPETVVNLSAVYPGKDGRSVKWEFLQTNQLKCVPHHDEEYAIYYAYTELYFDRPMELWVAIGSDDKADVWVNGLPIWISGSQLKNRRWDEGLRKVAFRQGVNRILYRVENGWLGMSFSMAVQVKP